MSVQQNKCRILPSQALHISTILVLISILSGCGGKPQPPGSKKAPRTATLPQPTRADQSPYEKNARLATTSRDLTNADLAWHAVNTYGWDCSEVISRGPTTPWGYFIIQCSNGTKLLVYPRYRQHPRITNENGDFK